MLRIVLTYVAIIMMTGVVITAANGQVRNDAQNCAIASAGTAQGNTLNCGYTSEQVQALIASAIANQHAQMIEKDDLFLKYVQESSLTEAAARAVLVSLGSDQATIPREHLANALFAEIGQIVATRQQLSRLSTDIPQVTALTKQALGELDAGHFANADRLLENILDQQHATATTRRDAADVARMGWLTELKAEANTSALLARSALRQRNATLAEYRLEKGIDILAPASMEVRLSYGLEAASILLDFGDAFGDQKALLASIAISKSTSSLASLPTHVVQKAKAQLRLGVALWRLGRREANTIHLHDAVVALKASLEISDRNSIPEDWAGIQIALGAVFLELDDREIDGNFLDSAINEFKSAAEVFSQNKLSAAWIVTELNIGNSLVSSGEATDNSRAIIEGLRYLNNALGSITKYDDPMLWSVIQTNVGIAYKVLGGFPGNAQLISRALSAYHASLEFKTRNDRPLEWAKVQFLIGNALLQLSRTKNPITDGDSVLDQSIAAFKLSLLEQTQDNDPLEWAMTHMSLGDAFLKRGQDRSDPAYLDAAVNNYNSSLSVISFGGSPATWTLIQMNLGIALERTWFVSKNRLSVLEESATAFRGALKGTRRPSRRATIQEGLGDDLQILGEWKSDHHTSDLLEAIAMYKLALDVWAHERNGTEFATTQMKLGNTFWLLGMREVGVLNLEAAIAAWHAYITVSTNHFPSEWWWYVTLQEVSTQRVIEQRLAR